MGDRWLLRCGRWVAELPRQFSQAFVYSGAAKFLGDRRKKGKLGPTELLVASGGAFKGIHIREEGVLESSAILLFAVRERHANEFHRVPILLAAVPATETPGFFA